MTNKTPGLLGSSSDFQSPKTIQLPIRTLKRCKHFLGQTWVDSAESKLFYAFILPSINYLQEFNNGSTVVQWPSCHSLSQKRCSLLTSALFAIRKIYIQPAGYLDLTIFYPQEKTIELFHQNTWQKLQAKYSWLLVFYCFGLPPHQPDCRKSNIFSAQEKSYSHVCTEIAVRGRHEGTAVSNTRVGHRTLMLLFCQGKKGEGESVLRQLIYTHLTK